MNKFEKMLASIDNTARDESSSILVIDGLNTFLRSFTMINHINPDGHHIGGLTGFLKSIGYAIKLVDPTKVIVVFDGVGGSSSRRNLYPEYKANRHRKRMTNYDIFSSLEEENESIENQMERLIQYCQCLPITMISIDGIEADDVMGYLATKFSESEKTKEIHLMSSDQDFLQLLNDKVKIYSPTKKTIYDVERFKSQFGFHPNNYLMYKTFMGDMGDNVPKVKGLGESKLFKVLPQLKEDKELSLTEALSLIDLDDKWGVALMNYKHQLEINHQLMNLKDITLSQGDVEQIRFAFNNPYTLNSYLFMQMYTNDRLGESIPSAPSWLNQVFGGLSSFN